MMLSRLHHLAGSLRVDSKISEVTLLQPWSNLGHADWSVTRVNEVDAGEQETTFLCTPLTPASHLQATTPHTCMSCKAELTELNWGPPGAPEAGETPHRKIRLIC